MNARDEFSARLRAAMAAAGLPVSATELERVFNRQWGQAPVSVQAAWNWINGRAMPRNDKLQVLARLLRIDPHALLYGAPEPASVAERRREWEDRLSYAERETIDAFLRLPAPQRLVVRELILSFAERHGAVDPAAE